jgi:hypothetical protein
MAGWQDYGTDDGVLPMDSGDLADDPAPDLGSSALLEQLRRMQARLDAVEGALTLEQQAKRKVSVILSQQHQRIANLEATINTFMGSVVDAAAGNDDADEISFAEAVRLSATSTDAPQRQRQIDVDSMPNSDGTTIYRFKLPGRRSAKVTEYEGMAVGDAWVDEPNGVRTPMKLIDAQELLDQVIDIRRRPPGGGDPDPNFDQRVINPESGVH